MYSCMCFLLISFFHGGPCLQRGHRYRNRNGVYNHSIPLTFLDYNTCSHTVSVCHLIFDSHIFIYTLLDSHFRMVLHLKCTLNFILSGSKISYLNFIFIFILFFKLIFYIKTKQTKKILILILKFNFI